jgi:hypothetical protein
MSDKAVFPKKGTLPYSLPILIDGTYIYDSAKGTYRPPKANDISDLAMLVELPKSDYFITIEDLEKSVGYPKKVITAKLRNLIKRDLVEGCDCGKCPGFYALTELGYTVLMNVSPGRQ